MSQFERQIQDAQLATTKALPAAGAANQTTAIDLGAGGEFQPENFQVEIAVPATPNLADTKNLDIHLEDSADNSSWADVDPFTRFRMTGSGGAGAVAKTVRFRLPSTTRRYIRFDQAVEAAGGDNTGVTASYKLLF